MHFKLVTRLVEWPETLSDAQLRTLTAYYRACLVRQRESRLALDLLVLVRDEVRRRRAEALMLVELMDEEPLFI